MEEQKIIKDFTKWVDSQVDFNGIIGGLGGKLAETVDGAIFGFAIKFGYDKIPTDFQDEALVIMQAVTGGDVESLADSAIEALVSNIKTPLSNQKEAIILGGIWDIIHKLMKAS